MGYSLEEDTEKGKYIESAVFKVGGYDWTILYYPGGSKTAAQDHVSIYLSIESNAECVKAQWIFTVVDQTESGLPTISKKTGTVRVSTGNDWGYPSFAKRKDLKPLIKDDCLVIEVVLTVFEVFPAERTTMIAAVPPVNMQHQFGLFLESEKGADVPFEVNGNKFRAHKCILVARSSVFSAQFFGSMKPHAIVKIEEMEPVVFKTLLYFIYNDSIPRFEEIEGCEEKSETQSVAQHLLVAADRYDLERLRIMCENFLSENIDESNVVTLLTLAERHSCNNLKAACLRFLASPGMLEVVAETEQFQSLVGSPHSILNKPLQTQQ